MADLVHLTFDPRKSYSEDGARAFDIRLGCWVRTADPVVVQLPPERSLTPPPRRVGTSLNRISF